MSLAVENLRLGASYVMKRCCTMRLPPIRFVGLEAQAA